MTRLRRVLLAVVVGAGGIVAGLGSVGVAGADSSGAVYHVANTGGSSLHVRSAPSLSASVTGTLPAGATIVIACQTTGDEVNGVSDIWDQLTSGGYVSDYYVDTPGVGVPSPGIPSCSAPASPPAPPAQPAQPVVTVPVPVPVPVTGPTARPGALRVKLAISWTWNRAITELRNVRIGSLPAQTSLLVRCVGRGCPRPTRMTATGSRAVRRALRRMSGRRYRAGDRLLILLQAAGRKPERAEIDIRAGRMPRARLLPS